MSSATLPATSPKPRRPPRGRRKTSLFAHGEPMVWLTGGALAIAIFMISGLLLLVLANGLGTFWPSPILEVKTLDGQALLGQEVRDESYQPTPDALAAFTGEAGRRAAAAVAANDGALHRRLYRTENFKITQNHYDWVEDARVAAVERPEWAVLLETQNDGRYYGYPDAYLVDGKAVADGPQATWKHLQADHDAIRDRFEEIHRIETDEIGSVRNREEQARIRLRAVEIDHGRDSPEYARAAEEHARTTERLEAEGAKINEKLAKLKAKNATYALRLKIVDGREAVVPVAEIVRSVAPNRLGFFGKLGVYLSRWGEYLTADPREANSAGGVFPAIVGTVLLTFLMTLMAVPFGVLAALYLHEYAKGGVVVSTVRIAINNLAGVPSIVFGVFGLGFFCYVVGGAIDQWFFAARLPNPTFGKSGLIWASLTLALLTLPVVIVATEEALASVPGSMREGSYACGASKWQTIRRIVLPRSMPGILTGTILAIARGAGEVAPIMLVGAVKVAPDLPGAINGIPPYVHVERSFMHLGFHIFDLGFQSQNSEAAKPMVFTTTLLLIGIVVLLNVFAILIRNRLRKKFEVGHF